MELWFSDYQTEKVKVSVKVQKQLFGLQTEFQRIDVFDSDEFGRFLSADGSIVFSEKDEFIYDEMIVHVPMAVHPQMRKLIRKLQGQDIRCKSVSGESMKFVHKIEWYRGRVSLSSL